MGAVVFDNLVFDSWLTKKSDQILNKIDRETISTEEMLTLILKAQTNHFHHMDVEFRQEFKRIDERFQEIDLRFEKIDLRFEKIDQQFKKIDERFEVVDEKIDDLSARMDKQFSILDEKIGSLRNEFKTDLNLAMDKMSRVLMWSGGMIFTLFAGLYLKLFLG